MRWRGLERIVFILFLILIISSIFLYQISGDNIDIEKVRQYLKNFGVLAPIIFIALYTLGTIFIPSTPFMAIAGILFGFKYGLIYTVIGGFLSSIIAFSISRKLGKNWAEDILQYKYMRHLGDYNKRLEQGAVWDLIILRILPIMPFNVLNVLMGVSRIKTAEYIFGTFIGLAPSNVLAVYFGSFITKIF